MDLFIFLLLRCFPLQASENLPENTVAALFLLCLDASFAEAFPSAHESAVAYLELASPDSHALFRRASRAAHSMEATCAFLKEADAEVIKPPPVSQTLMPGRRAKLIMNGINNLIEHSLVGERLEKHVGIDRFR